MATRHKLWIATLLIVAMLIPSIVQAQGGGRSVFSWIVANRITVGTGDLTAQDDATITDDLTIGGSVIPSEQTGITLTTGSTLAPAGSSQPIRSAGTINFGAISGCATATAGQWMVVINDTATTINITDSATLRLTGNLALGQFDTVLLYCDGATWVQLATANN